MIRIVRGTARHPSFRDSCLRAVLGLLVLLACAGRVPASTVLLVSEYGSGNIRAFDPADGSPITLPSHYSPVGGNASGADGMVQDAQGRLYVNHGDGTISRRHLDGDSFSTFADLEVLYLLDLTRNETHLFAAQYAENTIYQVSLADASISTIAGPSGTDRFDGVRIGPDGRLYAVESADGGIYAYDLASETWSTFLTPDNAGDASQVEFGADGRVFLSRTIGGQARIYAYTLNTPGNYSSGLDPASQTLIGAFGSFGAATGIRIGPDGRLYANAFNAGEVWRSNVGITAMEPTAFITGLNEPGSILFEAAAAPEGPTILIDFGIDTHETPSPDANGNDWNNFSTNSSQAPSGTIPNLVTSSNSFSGIQASVSGFGNGANAAGTTVPDPVLGSLAVASATRDSFFVQTGTGTVSFAGLQPNRYYRFECFAARDAEEVRVTRYTTIGAETTTATLVTSGAGTGQAPEPDANNSNWALLDNVRPTPAGQVTLGVTVESGSFAYLGAMRITILDEVSGPNEAPVADNVTILGAIAGGRSVRVFYDYADAEGDPEGDTVITWQFAEPPFSPPFLEFSGTERDRELVEQPGDWYVRAAVEPHAAMGTVTGAVAYSAWRGPIASADAMTVFHVGNSFTRWGHVPLQLQNLAASAAAEHVYGEQLRDGEGLAYHWANGLADGVWTRGTPSRLELETGTWDWLVLQPMSREWTAANLGAFEENAVRFATLAVSNGTRVALYHYWNYLDEAPAVQTQIDEAFDTVLDSLSAEGIDAVLIPVGAAFTDAVAAIPGLARDDLYQDNIHPSDIGYCLSALTHYATLYRRSPVGLTNGAISAAFNNDDPILLDAALAEALQQVAWDTARYHSRSGVTAGRFAEWAAPLPEEERGWADDPFDVQIPNLLRWAFGFDAEMPTDSALGPRVIGGQSQYSIGADAADAGVRIIEHWSTNLVTWSTNVPSGFSVVIDDGVATIEPGGEAYTVFLRFEASAP